MGQLLQKAVEFIKNKAIDVFDWMVDWMRRNKIKTACIVGGIVFIAIPAAAYYGAPLLVQLIEGAEVVATTVEFLQVALTVGQASSIVGGIAGAAGAAVVTNKLWRYLSLDSNSGQIRAGQGIDVQPDQFNYSDQYLQWPLLEEKIPEQIMPAIKSFFFKKFEQFQKSAIYYSCPITKRVPSKIALTKCCQKLFDLSAIKTYVAQNKKCKCGKDMSQKQIIEDENDNRIIERSSAILVLRYKIRKLYNQSSDNIKTAWRAKIDQYMGKGYVQHRLQ